MAMGTIFMVSALLAVLNGVYIYVTSWSSPQVMAMASYGFKVAPVSHLERTVAVFLITFAVLNAWAAFYGSKSFRMLTSFLNMIVVTHYFIEVWVGAYTGFAFLCSFLFLYINLRYSCSEFGRKDESRRRRRSAGGERRSSSFVSSLTGRRNSSSAASFDSAR